MRSHTPAGTWNPDTKQVEFNGKTLCGQKSGHMVTGRPECVKCRRFSRTVPGVMRVATDFDQRMGWV